MTGIVWASENPGLAWVLVISMLLAGAGILYLVLHLLPRETIPPLLLTAFLHNACYFGPRLLPTLFPPHDLTLPIDAAIPFFTPMVLVYLLAYLQWGLYWIQLGREDQRLRSRSVSGEWIAKLICAVVFILFPTTFSRPEATGTGIFDRITALMFQADVPTNLLPSIHCVQSWFCLRGALRFRNVPRWYRPVSVLFSLLVFASTLLVKQHVLLDLPAAILVAEAGLLIAPFLKLDRLVILWESALKKKRKEQKDT